MKRMIVGFLAGLIAHGALYDVINNETSVPDLYSYASGILVIRAVFFHFNKDPIARRDFDHASLLVGIGVVCGRQLRRLLLRDPLVGRD